MKIELIEVCSDLGIESEGLTLFEVSKYERELLLVACEYARDWKGWQGFVIINGISYKVMISLQSFEGAIQPVSSVYIDTHYVMIKNSLCTLLRSFLDGQIDYAINEKEGKETESATFEELNKKLNEAEDEDMISSIL